MFLTYSSDEDDDEALDPPPSLKKRKSPELLPNRAPAMELILEVREKKKRCLEREEEREGGKRRKTFFSVARQEAKVAIEKRKQAREYIQNPPAPPPAPPVLRGTVPIARPTDPKKRKASITFFSCNSEKYKSSSALRPPNSQRVDIKTRKARNIF
ncbi:hypothetical protein TWF481_001792 [Arthrobotrys musiformis]|uniref:TPX2 C-terminal domain-containing protein n=1 Tax=Arthrobotrys musiformis TaxID=47236 RepID=A0AAV9VUI3_9PEZI